MKTSGLREGGSFNYGHTAGLYQGKDLNAKGLDSRIQSVHHSTGLAGICSGVSAPPLKNADRSERDSLEILTYGKHWGFGFVWDENVGRM
jgi:hypothetical protein